MARSDLPCNRRHRRRFFRPRLEVLEGRQMPSTFRVTNTNDTGPGSLRQAILDANAQPGLDTIAFNVAGAGTPVLRPTTVLPAVTDPVVIDGTTQPGSHRVVLNGSHAGAGVNGLTITAGSSTVKGLAIGGFAGDGLVLLGAGGNIVAGDYLGTDFSGSGTPGNVGSGLSVLSDDNVIGGTTAAASNVISGNQGSEVNIADGNNNVVEGNFIGSDPGGFSIFANATGVSVGGMNNLIGGTTAAARNLISGNTVTGVHVAGAGNRVQGNYVGTTATGRGIVVLPNATGVTISGPGNTIGGTAPGAGNLISANRGAGVLVLAADAVIQGNLIGTDSTGAGSLGNAAGITVSGSGVTGVRIGGTTSGSRNVISGNTSHGILLDGASRNTIQGNYIGLDATGTTAMWNEEGAVAQAGAAGNFIGGTTSGAGNVMAARQGAAVELTDGATANLVQGNKLGTDAAGMHGLFDLYGVLVSGNSPDNVIGGTVAGAGNLISASRAAGIGLFESSDRTRVQGNRIGTDASGTHALANPTGLVVDTSENVIGGTDAGAGNLISGNTSEGIHLGANGNLIAGNRIGTDVTGTQAVANQTGILVAAADNTIGGADPGAGNLIAGNTGTGVRLDGGASNTVIQGNQVGTDSTGTHALDNATGVEVAFGGSNLIGGTTAAAANVISGNLGPGIVINTSGNWVQGNRIGTNAAGTAAVPNLIGVLVTAAANTIGGTVAGAGNLIAGNTSYGIQMTTPLAAGNTVEGNLVGTDLTGEYSLHNSFGVYLLNGAHDNIIGGTESGAGNLISGNATFGVDIDGRDTTGNVVQGDFIGTDAAGVTALSNSTGVYLGGPNNTLGGTTPAARNVISGNAYEGVGVGDFPGNRITGNYIGTDSTGTRVAVGGSQGTGVSIGFGATDIGGTEAGAGNLIAGNDVYGIILFAAGTRIQGNYIGTDVTGTRALGGGRYEGIASEGNDVLIGGTAPGAGNVISGNAGWGITISASANVVQGNFIGTDASGASDLANGMDGVSIFAGADNVIGGTTPGAGNLIAGNVGRGISVLNAPGTVIQGNFIGTDASGTAALGNGADGIAVLNSSRVIIGGTTAAANVIAGNGGAGVLVSGSNAAANLIAGNFIGTDLSGTLALGNDTDGVAVQGASDNTVGGTAAGARNTIAFNGRDGVRVDGGTGNSIQRNSIFGQENGLGIELLNGGNQGQGFPTLTAATTDGDTTTVAGTLAGVPATTFTVEIFVNDECNPSGYGEGAHFLAALAVAADGDGNAGFAITVAIAVNPGQFITATATDPDGNTSEFSACLVVTGPGTRGKASVWLRAAAPDQTAAGLARPEGREGRWTTGAGGGSPTGQAGRPSPPAIPSTPGRTAGAGHDLFFCSVSQEWLPLLPPLDDPLMPCRGSRAEACR